MRSLQSCCRMWCCCWARVLSWRVQPCRCVYRLPRLCPRHEAAFCAQQEVGGEGVPRGAIRLHPKTLAPSRVSAARPAPLPAHPDASLALVPAHQKVPVLAPDGGCILFRPSGRKCRPSERWAAGWAAPGQLGPSAASLAPEASQPSSGSDGRKGWGLGCACGRLTHRPHEAAQLLPVGVDLLLQDVVLCDLLLQLRHARPILALADLILQRSWPLSSTLDLGRSPPMPSRALPASPSAGAELVFLAEGGQARRIT